MDISDKIALVTGGSRGLGRNMAIQLARNGADVMVTWRSQKDEAASVCAEIEELGRKSAHLQLDAAIISSFSSPLGYLLREGWSRDDFDRGWDDGGGTVEFCNLSKSPFSSHPIQRIFSPAPEEFILNKEYKKSPPALW
jgi:NAD(P)-dependent dehydrogenase (short-subunit alcohol dehydrogenase family)